MQQLCLLISLLSAPSSILWFRTSDYQLKCIQHCFILLPLLLKLNNLFSFWNLPPASYPYSVFVRWTRQAKLLQSFCAAYLSVPKIVLVVLLYSCFSLSSFLQNWYPASQSAVFAGSVMTLWLRLSWVLSPVVEWRLHLLAPSSFLQLKLPECHPTEFVSDNASLMCYSLKIIQLTCTIDALQSCFALPMLYGWFIFLPLYSLVGDSLDSV